MVKYIYFYFYFILNNKKIIKTLLEISSEKCAISRQGFKLGRARASH